MSRVSACHHPFNKSILKIRSSLTILMFFCITTHSQEFTHIGVTMVCECSPPTKPAPRCHPKSEHAPAPISISISIACKVPSTHITSSPPCATLCSIHKGKRALFRVCDNFAAVPPTTAASKHFTVTTGFCVFRGMRTVPCKPIVESYGLRCVPVLHAIIDSIAVKCENQSTSVTTISKHVGHTPLPYTCASHRCAIRCRCRTCLQLRLDSLYLITFIAPDHLSP